MNGVEFLQWRCWLMQLYIAWMFSRGGFTHQPQDFDSRRARGEA